MKKIALITLIFFQGILFAEPIIKIEKGIVTLDGKKWILINETVIDKTSTYYVLYDLKGELFAQLTIVNNTDKVFLQAEFRNIAKKYATNHPAGSDIQTLLESYNRNKVIVDGNIDLAGLQKYCDERSIPLNKVLTPVEENEREANQTVTYSYSSESNNKDGASKNTGASSSLPKNISFTLKNNSSKSVRYFIGKEAKYGSGKYSTTGGNTISSENGTVGDKICIVDNNDNPISCTTISDGMGRVEINSSGTGFGN